MRHGLEENLLHPRAVHPFLFFLQGSLHLKGFNPGAITAPGLKTLLIVLCRKSWW
jgi:hypothetical protein